MRKKIVIVGAGAMGTLFAALLSRSTGIEVTLAAKTPSAASRLRKKGIILTGAASRLRVPPKKIEIVSPADLARLKSHRRKDSRVHSADIAVILVKSFDTASAVRDFAPLIGRETVVLTFQNGLGNVEAIKKTLDEILPRRLRPSAILSGATTVGATLIKPGVVVHTGEGETLIAYDSARERKYAARSCELLAGAGIKVRAVRGSASILWSKLIVNAAINPVGALFLETNGEILKNDFALSMTLNAAREAAAVARAENIRLLYRSPSAKVKSVLASTSRNKNSMLGDILSGRPTEIDAINGAVLRVAKRLGVSAPYNRVLRNSVRICR
ncbi:MAG: 2-dehydropantoate 2-reductase [Endomicrobiia bacterium]|nr:2-dehydropantoate 2-reductase [Endomicrobiia bacterium]